MGRISKTHAAVSPFLDDIRQREAAARADGFRAGAEAMRAAALAVIPEVNGAEIDDAIRALPIPESDNG